MQVLSKKSVGLYVHVPFCLRKCLFCSFVVAIGQEHRRDEYVDALIKQARVYEGCCVHSIYLGGGTPSYLPDDSLKRLMEALRQHFIIDADAEITIEANPENMSLEKAKLIKQLGFNRVSLGVQSFNDVHLKFLGRCHDASQAKQAFFYLREAGITNINVDLMYGFVGQTAAMIHQDIDDVASLKSEHVSIYTLTIEPHSKFYARQMKLDSDEHLADMYVLVSDLLEGHQLFQYEISNFSRRGFESKHNQHYWQGDEYVALGVGAHGYLNGQRFWFPDKLQDYLANPMNVAGVDIIDERTQLMEKVCFGLRTRQGVAKALIPEDRQRLIEQWVGDGFLVEQHGRIMATRQGQLVLDELSARLI